MQADPLEFLASESNTDQQFDIAILSLCSYYFQSRSLLLATLRALHSRTSPIETLFLAEWGLSSSDPTAQPHILAVLAQAALERYNPLSSANVRTVLSPKELRKVAEEAGWKLVVRSSGDGEETYLVPADNVLDGRWEVAAASSKDFLKSLDELVKDEKERGVIVALRDAVLASAERIGGRGKVSSMDVWCATFSR